MFLERRGAHFGRLEMLFHSLPHRAAPAVPQIEDHRNERAVVRAGGDAHVKVTIGGDGVLILVGLLLHRLDGRTHESEVGLGRFACGQRRDLAFDEPSGA